MKSDRSVIAPSVIDVNKFPLRWTRQYSKTTPKGAASATTDIANIADIIYCLDFSGSQTRYSYNQLVDLNAKFPQIGVYPFGSEDHAHSLNTLTTLNGLFRTWITPKTSEAYGFSFPFPTSPLFIRQMFHDIPKDRPIQLVFNGDGAFSYSQVCPTFIEIVREAKRLGYFNNIVSFTILFSENTSPGTRRVLEPQLKEILVSSDSLMKFECIQLRRGSAEMSNRFSTLRAKNIKIPDGFLKFDNQLYHRLLTPQSLAEIFKHTPTLIQKYTQRMITIFMDTPGVLISPSNIAGKIYKALIALIQFNNDQFAIKLYFLNEISRIKDIHDSQYDTRQRVYENFRKADESNKLLMVARLVDQYSGLFISLRRDSATDIGAELTQFGAAIRDGSHYQMCAYLTKLYNEHSDSTMVTNSDTGFPILKDDASEQDKIYSFGLIANLFGFDKTTIGNSTLIVIAMFCLTNEYFDNDYVKHLAELYLFSTTNFEKINSMLYSSPTEFQNHMFSAPFSMLIYNTIRTFSSRFIAKGFTTDQLNSITKVYKVICKMTRSHPHSYSLNYRVKDYDFKTGDIYLLSNKSWEDAGKTIPFPTMPCIGYIGVMTRSDIFRGDKSNKVKFQYFEGGNDDYIHLDRKYLIRFSTNHTDEQFQAIKDLQSTLWDDYKRGCPSPNTYEQNFQNILHILGDSYNTDVQAKDTYTGVFKIDGDTTRSILNFNSPTNRTGIPSFIKKIHVLAWSKLPIETYGNTPIRPVTVNIPLTNGYTQPYTLTTEDSHAICKDFDCKVAATYTGRECSCGCEMMIRPGVDHVRLSCDHRIIKPCHTRYIETTVQDINSDNIRLDVSRCSMGCVECIQDAIHLSDGSSIRREDISGEIMAASATNFIGVCDKCVKLFIRGPRNCGGAHTLPTTCHICSPQKAWKCRECDIFHEHIAGCRWMKCCARFPEFDVECLEHCDHCKYIDGVLIAKGCGATYKMEDGEVQDEGRGAARSDGSYHY